MDVCLAAEAAWAHRVLLEDLAEANDCVASLPLPGVHEFACLLPLGPMQAVSLMGAAAAAAVPPEVLVMFAWQGPS
jgi:hypothetical protein